MLICDDRQVAIPCFFVYSLRTRARYSRSGSHDVNKGWPSHKLFLILFFPLKLELFTFQICNFLKVDIFKNEIKIVWVLLKFYLPQNESQCLFNIYFAIINFAFLFSVMPLSPVYGRYILHSNCKACFANEKFSERGNLLTKSWCCRVITNLV